MGSLTMAKYSTFSQPKNAKSMKRKNCEYIKGFDFRELQIFFTNTLWNKKRYQFHLRLIITYCLFSLWRIRKSFKIAKCEISFQTKFLQNLIDSCWTCFRNLVVHNDGLNYAIFMSKFKANLIKCEQRYQRHVNRNSLEKVHIKHMCVVLIDPWNTC